MASGAGDLGASERNWIGYWLVVVLFLRFVRFLPDIVSSRAEKKKIKGRKEKSTPNLGFMYGPASFSLCVK